MTTITNAEQLRQYKSRFPVIVEQILAFASSTNLEKLRVCLQMSNDLYDDVLRYK